MPFSNLRMEWRNRMKRNVACAEPQVERRFEGELTLSMILRIWLKNHFKGDAM